LGVDRCDAEFGVVEHLGALVRDFDRAFVGGDGLLQGQFVCFKAGDGFLELDEQLFERLCGLCFSHCLLLFAGYAGVDPAVAERDGEGRLFCRIAGGRHSSA
jgi:hypothetical protein